MLWREQVDTVHCTFTDDAEVWIFAPDNPGQLFLVGSNVPHPIFCSGASWDRNGKLVIAGGNHFGPPPSPPPSDTHRFDPNKLRELAWSLDPLPQGGGGGGGGTPTDPMIPGNPWSANIPMSIERYYPTLTTLDRRPITSNCSTIGTIPGGSQVVLGGPPEEGNAPTHDEGNELWQILAPGATSWNRTLRLPAGTPDTHDPGGPTENYLLENPPLEHLLDSYPRSFQMGEFHPTATVNGQIFVANDVQTQASNALPDPNSPGRSWAMKPPASTTDGCWHLRHGPNAGAPTPPGTNDRWYAPAVLMHTLDFRNRVLVFGGSQPLLPASPPNYRPPYEVNDSVQEFTPNPAGSGGPIAGGSWADKHDMLFPRVYPSAVLLPTGKIFIVGGLAIDKVHNPGPYPACDPCPQTVPELYDPGSPGSSGSTTALAQGNVPTGWFAPTPRGYHHVAVLLPDGRVLVAGGRFRGQHPGDFYPADPVTNPYPPSKYTGEIFSPPYLFLGPRPTITTHDTLISFSTNTAASTFQFRFEHHQDHVAKVVLTRPASVTHLFDVDQRYIELAFTAEPYSTGPEISVVATAPHESLGPPGWYMLWVVEADTPAETKLIPSVAKFVLLN